MCVIQNTVLFMTVMFVLSKVAHASKDIESIVRCPFCCIHRIIIINCLARWVRPQLIYLSIVCTFCKKATSLYLKFSIFYKSESDLG